MLNEKLQVGLLGIGKMGTYHLEKLLQHPKIHLVGVYDKDTVRANQIAQNNGVTAYATCEELFFDVDAVFISSPTTTHFELAKKALENNLHVFVEKPMCDRLDLAAELVKVSKERNLVLQTGFVERYRWLSLISCLAQKEIRKPLLISAERNAVAPSREKGMNVVSDLMIHDIDLTLWMAQEPPMSFSAEGISAGLTDIDIAYVRLEFPSGTVAHLKANWVAPKRHRESQIVWNDRVINFDLLNGVGHVLEIGNSGPEESRTYSLANVDPLHEQIDYFIKAVQGSKRPAVTGLDGLRALEISEAIMHKIKEKQTERIRLSPLEKKFLSRFWGDYVH